MNITITRALTRIKSIDKLLEKELSANQTPFVVAVKKDSKIAGFENKESYMTAVKARLQSINALINDYTSDSIAQQVTNCSSRDFCVRIALIIGRSLRNFCAN